MAPDDMIFISVDDHVVEPPDMFDGRMPRALAERAPRVERTPDGSDVWVFERATIPNIGLNAVAGRPKEEYGVNPTAFDETYPGRHIPMALPMLWDPELAAAEVRRVAAKGCHSLTFTENPATLGLPSFHSDHWDPLWRALVDGGTVLNIHLGSSGQPHSDSSWPRAPEELATVAARFDVPRAEIDRITHENAMAWYRFDPFEHRRKEDCTVAALRAEVADHDVSIRSYDKGRFGESERIGLGQLAQQATA